MSETTIGLGDRVASLVPRMLPTTTAQAASCASACSGNCCTLCCCSGSACSCVTVCS